MAESGAVSLVSIVSAGPPGASGAVEEVVAFRIAGKRLYGILHLPAEESRIGSAILMVPGGPQTRVGCHRAYVHIARSLCRSGHCVLRFDYEGLGDSEGPFVGYEYAAPSIRGALDFLRARLPGAGKIVLWSLCDGSAASAVYARFDRPRIHGMILCNPFVQSVEGKAQTYLKHYYIRRVFQKDFLNKVLRLDFDWKASLKSLFTLLGQAKAGRKKAGSALPEAGAADARGCFLEANVKQEVLAGVAAFGKPIHFLLSGNDFTAREFQDLVEADPRTAGMLAENMICLKPVKGADHTFSKAAFRLQVCNLTVEAMAVMGAHPVQGG